MTLTPWGHSEGLRTRRLPPGPGTAAEMVTANQRERLLGAMVAVVAERGYEAARVADVLELSGVSRSAYYRLFDSKLDCFLATVDAIAEAAAEAVIEASSGDGDWEERLRSGIDVLIGLVVAQPAAARLCLVDVHAAGPDALERVDRQARRIGRLARQVIAEAPERAGMPPEVVRAVMGGMRQVIERRVREGRVRELPALSSQLADWALSYRTPPQSLATVRGRPRAVAAATGSDPDDARQRILAAMTEVVADKGYHASTITDIAQRASVSLTTFYLHFSGKDDAFLAAVDRAATMLMEATLPAYRDAADWPHAIRGGVEAFLAQLSRETAIARLGGEAVWAAGPPALARFDTGVAAFQALLGEGTRRRPTAGIAAEAVSGGIVALVCGELRRRGAERLYRLAPAATFVALAPYIGTIEACAIANGQS
jgi:AcrR family transcriptional regulator